MREAPITTTMSNIQTKHVPKEHKVTIEGERAFLACCLFCGCLNMATDKHDLLLPFLSEALAGGIRPPWTNKQGIPFQSYVCA